MKVYIVVYHHRHGTDAWPLFREHGQPAPTPTSVVDELEDFELGETVAVEGPWGVPI